MPPSARSRFELSDDVRQLILRLEKAQPGDLIRYDDLSALLGYPVQQKRWLLDSARKYCRTHHGIVFGAVSRQGVKRLDDTTIVHAAPTRVRRVHRQANEATKDLACVELETLSADLQHKALVFAGFFAALMEHTTLRSIRAIEAMHQADIRYRIDPEHYRDLFRKRSILEA